MPVRRTLALTSVLALTLSLAQAPHAAAKQPLPPPTPLPSAYAGSSSQKLPTEALDRWWLLFNDPTLNALEAEAFETSPDIRTAQARILEARATRAAQLAQTLPTGELQGTASRQAGYVLNNNSSDLSSIGGVTQTYASNFNISWELDLFGRLAAQRRVARATDAEARFNVEGARATLAADVADAYFQTRGLRIRLDDALATARIERDLLDIARRKALAGAGPDDDQDRVGAQVAHDDAQAADLQAQLDDQRRLLLILVGRDLRDLDRLPDAPPPQVPLPPRALPSELLARRPDIREAEYRLRAELGTAALAHKAIFPTITLLPALGANSTTSPGVSYIPPTTLVTAEQTFSTGFWTLGAGINVPVLDIPKLLDQAHAEDARARQVAIAYQKTVRTAFGEAQNALDDLAAGERATDLLTTGEQQARKAYEGSRRRYAAGLDDLTTTLTAEQSWRDLRSALTAERVDTLRKAVRTYKALGGGWSATGEVG